MSRQDRCSRASKASEFFAASPNTATMNMRRSQIAFSMLSVPLSCTMRSMNPGIDSRVKGFVKGSDFPRNCDTFQCAIGSSVWSRKYAYLDDAGFRSSIACGSNYIARNSR
jgi:hypothetical protein